MGVILDSSVTITAERSGETAEQLLRRVLIQVGNQQVGISAIGYTEMIHGLYRTTTSVQHSRRKAFLEGLARETVIYPYTQAAAEIAGKIDAERRAAKQTVPYVDLLIGATALSLNFSVLTTNVRHFRLIPGLNVIPF